MSTWADELPFVLLGLRAQPREDTGLSVAESAFGDPIFLPNEFLQSDEFAVDSIIKNLKKTLDAPAYSLPRHNCSSGLPRELKAELISARLVWICRCGAVLRSSRCTTAPSPPSAAEAAPLRCRSGPEKRLSPSAA
jgi:hypothetical protein